MSQETVEQSPALTASQNSWRCVHAHDKEGWLALMADDVVDRRPDRQGVSPTPTATGVRGKEAVAVVLRRQHRPTTIRITCEETFPSSSPDEIAHILVLRFTVRRTGSISTVRGIFTYKVNDAGLLTNLRGYWNMDAMQFVQDGRRAISEPLAGRGAVVVGGTRGVGLAVAELLAAQGAGVVVNGRDPDAAAEAAQRIRGAVAFPGSPADPAVADALIDTVRTGIRPASTSW